jgi:adenylate cyclase
MGNQQGERRLAAVLAADVVGYSRLMGQDESGTLNRLKSHLSELVLPCISEHGGRVVKLMGDGVLAEFTSVVEAVQCAVEIQDGMAQRNATMPENDRQVLRIGVNFGDVIAEGDDIYGDGVNVASRLEELAEPGGICVRSAVRDEVRDKVPYSFEDLGFISVKNIARPMHTYRLRREKETVSVGSKSPRDRRRLIVALSSIALLGLAIAGAWWFDFPARLNGVGGSYGSDHSVPSIAVLPFANLGNEAEQEYFADGLTDDLINDLSKISGLAVIARSSVFPYKNAPASIREVARDLGVRYVLEGSVRRAGGMIRINTQLADAATGRQIWADRYDREASEIFELQYEIIEGIAKSLAITPSEGERARLTRIPTSNLDAYDAYLRAEALGVTTLDPEQMRQTVAHYRDAIALDPEFADAYAGLARASVDILRLGYAEGVLGSTQPGAKDAAFEIADKALRLDPDNARAHTVLASIQLIEQRHAEAIVSARAATAFAPSDPEAHAQLAVVLAYAGRVDESKAEISTALRLDPQPSRNVRELATLVLFITKDYQTAIDVAVGTDDELQLSEAGYSFLSAAYGRIGQIDKAKETVAPAIALGPAYMTQGYIRLAFDFFARESDRAHFIESLPLTGLPEWPYGFQGDPGHQVRGNELRDLAIGQTWRGVLRNGVEFFQFLDDRQQFAYRSATSFMSGRGYVEDDQLCFQIEGYVHGKEICGRVYRNMEKTGLPYIFVTPISLATFGLANSL